MSISRAAKRQVRKQRSINRERRIARRLKKREACSGRRAMAMSTMELEVSSRVRAHGAGGLGLIQQMVDRLGLADEIDERLDLLKVQRGYSESDHVLAVAYNQLAGGHCLQDLERLRTDEALLDNLGARSLPAPSTAGDFCRRFDVKSVDALMDAINCVRSRVWSKQGDEFLEEARIDGDGTIVETLGECKEGISLSYKGTWGYQPLLISLSNSNEPLFLVNRTASSGSADGAAEYYDKAIECCREAGFKSITLRGDTAFTQTRHLDKWNADGVRFVFGFSVVRPIRRRIEGIAEQCWQPLERDAGDVEGAQRQRPENVRQRIVTEKGYKDLRVKSEHITEFQHCPSRAKGSYRLVVLRKEVEAYEGETRLFSEYRYFCYITNDDRLSTQDVVEQANKRCAQEGLIGELKSGVRSLRAPVDNLVSNWAWMVMSTLAWSLKAWSGLLLPRGGRWAEKHQEDRSRIVRMGFRAYVELMIRVPAQVVLTGRKIRVRLLAWNSMQRIFLRLADVLERPALC